MSSWALTPRAWCGSTWMSLVGWHSVAMGFGCSQRVTTPASSRPPAPQGSPSCPHIGPWASTCAAGVTPPPPPPGRLQPTCQLGASPWYVAMDVGRLWAPCGAAPHRALPCRTCRGTPWATWMHDFHQRGLHYVMIVVRDVTCLPPWLSLTWLRFRGSLGFIHSVMINHEMWLDDS